MTAEGPQRCHWEVDLAIVYIVYINGIVKGLIERGRPCGPGPPAPAQAASPLFLLPGALICTACKAGCMAAGSLASDAQSGRGVLCTHLQDAADQACSRTASSSICACSGAQQLRWSSGQF